jgi:hypothetical protein
MRHEILEEFYNEDAAALRVNVTYTMRSGESFTLPAVTRTRIRGDKVAECPACRHQSKQGIGT